jgi:predicted membrane-bound spermidine synthase
MSLKLRAWLLFLIFLNGYVSLSLELIVIRQLGFYVGSSAIVTSIIIGTFLGFMSIGYFKGSNNKTSKSNVKTVLFRSFLTIALMGVLAGSFALISGYFGLMHSQGIYSIITQTFIYSIIFLSVAPFLFGLNTALLSKYLHKHNQDCTGSVMAWDTIGSVLGSLATTLLLMPFIGVNYTIILVTVLSLIAAYVAKPKPRLLILFAIIMIPAFWINSGRFLQKEFGIIVNNANSTISVAEFDRERVLFMNGVSMSFFNKQERTSAEYINYINQNFIYNMPRDRKRSILVLGAGGFTAGLNDSFNNYTFIDIEKTLKDVSESKFLGEKLTPNKTFIVQDASQFLKNTPIEYDLIILDIYSNSYQVPEGFITAEFMQRIKSRVADGGVILMNVICSPNFADEYTRVFDNTFRSVFAGNTQRQVMGRSNPWMENTGANVMYVYYNRPNSGRIYTINKTPVIYDRK